MAGPLRQKLVQARSDGGEGGEAGVLDCSCELPGEVGSGFPEPGQGEF